MKALSWTLLAVVLVASLGRGHSQSDSLYPYGALLGDKTTPVSDDGASAEIPIAVVFKFFNKEYKSLFVNNNGVISFKTAVSQYTPYAFPLTHGETFVTPFWGDVDNRLSGNVYYRESTDANLLQRITSDMDKRLPDQHFTATWAFLATWDKVAYFSSTSTKNMSPKLQNIGRSSPCSETRRGLPSLRVCVSEEDTLLHDVKQTQSIPNWNSRGSPLPVKYSNYSDRLFSCTVNTFQAALTTDGYRYYVILNYGDIHWTTGAASGGNPETGLGGIPAQAGFNSGDEEHYFNIPGSQTAEIINIKSTSNVNFPGQWIFRVDEFQVPGGCIYKYDAVCNQHTASYLLHYYQHGSSEANFAKEGDEFWTDSTCTTKCLCNGHGDIPCVNEACPPAATCEPSGSFFKCKQKAKFCF